MDEDEVTLGMRVAFTARAKKVKGIILKRRDPNVQGLVTKIGELVRVHWDDNEVYALNCYWLSRHGVPQIEREPVERVDRRRGPRGPQKRVLNPKIARQAQG